MNYKCSRCKLDLRNTTVEEINNHKAVTHSEHPVSLVEEVQLTRKQIEMFLNDRVYRSAKSLKKAAKKTRGKKRRRALRTAVDNLTGAMTRKAVFKKRDNVKSLLEGAPFYISKEWYAVRYEALKRGNKTCVLCGRTGRGVQLHVDHIVPRSIKPELQLSLDNLQVMCDACNLGKSNKDSTDWRTK